ncbi:MAG: type II toxin-antitoxin system Phd/YefM family antitoxin [Chloroflexi bacterium]|nr:type II toxin-antitoxin system Phd/YefM family antitoxin [Chloroflexota bacterium]
MSKTISATEAKNKLGSLISWVLEHEDEVIVESRGEPKVVIVPFAEYEAFKQVKEQARRQEALARLEALREQVSARNQDLTPEAGDALADRFSREFVEDLAKKGKIRFKKD